jgi:hypothetical protein
MSINASPPPAADGPSSLGQTGAPNRSEWLGLLRADQMHRWQRGERVLVEAYLQRFPALRSDIEGQLDLIYHEVLLRERGGEPRDLDEYLRRFPDYTAALRRRFELHQALASAGVLADSAAGPSGSGATPPPADGSSTPSLPPTTPPLEGLPLAAPAATAHDSPQTGKATAGRNLLFEEIGHGGMGSVRRGRDPLLGRELAVKVLKEEHRDKPEFIGRFVEEAQIGGQLQHPGLVPIYELGRFPDDRPFFTMKLVKGQTLAKLLGQRTSPQEELPRFLGIFEQVCQTVAYAHARGVLHRDLKPSNVMVGAFGEVQVMDWGLAKVLRRDADVGSAPPEDGAALVHTTRSGSGPDVSQAGRALGTLAYMPAEQARGEIDRIDERADVFGLGAILCVILTGQPPYRGRFDAVYDQAKRGDVADALVRLDGCGADAELVRLCKYCLAPERDDRPRDAGVVAQRIGAYQAGVQERLRRAELERAAAQVKAQEERKRRKLAVGLSAAVLLTLAAGMAGTSWGMVEARRARDDEARQRRTAEQEAAIALAVNEFLQQDLLGQADTGNQPLAGAVERNPNITVRELLDRAAKAIEGRFAEQPQTEAAIRLTLGDAYRALGRYAEAQPHLERSVWLRTDQLGADHPNTLQSKNLLAELHYHQGKYEQAEPLFQEVLAGRTTRLGADHPDTLQSKNNLALLYLDQGKPDRAEPLFQEAVAGRTAQLGANHPDTLNSKNNLSLLYKARGQYHRAEPLDQEVLAGRIAQLGADHPLTLQSKHNLASLYLDQGKPDRAEPLLREAVAGRTLQLGADHPDTLQSKNSLAVLYYQQRKYDQAEPLLLEVLHGWNAKLGGDHPHTLTSKHNLAALYRDQGKYDQAEPLFQAVLDARTAQLGPDHLNTLQSKYSLARLYLAQEQYERAEPLFREAVAGARTKLGLAHPHTQLFVRNLADCYEKLGQPAQAEPLLRELADFWKQKTGADSLQYAGELAILGLNLLRQQKPADAEPLLRTCLTIREKQLPDDWATYHTRSLLGGALVGQKRYAEAEPLLLTGYEGLKKREANIPAPAKVNLTEALARLVQLYDGWDQKDKADAWRTKLEQSKAAAKPPAQP